MAAIAKHIPVELGSLAGRENLYFQDGGRLRTPRSTPKRTLPWYVDEACFDEVVRLSRMRDGQTALDVFTGNPICGVTAIYLKTAAPSSEVIAIDKSPRLIEIAKENAEILDVKDIDFRVGDEEDLRFPDQTFDVVVDRMGLHWAVHPKVAVSESFRVLRPGGRFVFLDIVAPPDAEAQAWLTATYQHTYYRRDQLDSLFATAGFVEEERVPWPFAMTVDTMGWTSPERRERFLADFAAAPPRAREMYRITGSGDQLRFELDMVLVAYVRPATGR